MVNSTNNATTVNATDIDLSSVLEGVKVAVIMGSQSDWDVMSHAVEILEIFGISHKAFIISAHRTPERLYSFARGAEASGLQIIIAGAGGAAHLPGMTAALTTLPVLGVPVMSRSLQGVDSLYSIVQMPAGVPVGTLAIGKAGAVNAGLLAISILAIADPSLGEKLASYRKSIQSNVALFPSDQ